MTLRVSEDVKALNPGLAGELATMPASKYHNARSVAKGLRFQSGKEAKGCAELILLEEQKQVFGLRFQVRFPLPGGNTYVADACYSEKRDGKLQVIVRDWKGFPTEAYRIKRKLFKAEYGIEIEEG